MLFWDTSNLLKGRKKDVVDFFLKRESNVGQMRPWAIFQRVLPELSKICFDNGRILDWRNSVEEPLNLQSLKCIIRRDLFC